MFGEWRLVYVYVLLT